MRRVASLPVLLVLASVASSASIATTGVRVQAKGRITSASYLPDAVKSLSPQRNATLPISLPRHESDPYPYLTEFYGPAQAEAEAPDAAPAAPGVVPEASVRTGDPSSATR